MIRHGIFSDRKAMEPLEEDLLRHGVGVTDNRNYAWRQPILHSGIELANQILQAIRGNAAIERIVLVGHSQGGLVSRVAVAALCAHDDLAMYVHILDGEDPYYFGRAARDLETLAAQFRAELERAPELIRAVVMLGTPNAGAFTHGQLSLMATIAVRAGLLVGNITGLSNFEELTTEKLFRVLQNVEVRDVQYLSISGSLFNRYRLAGWSRLSELPVISRMAPSLDLPNDTVVEDESVDIREAPLPSEIADLDTQYRHIRTYRDCTSVGHTMVQSDANVLAIVADDRIWD